MLLLLAGAAFAASLSGSVVVGGVTSTHAKVSVRTDAAADVKIEYDDDSAFGSSTTTSASTTSSSSNFTTEIELSGMSASTTYYYKVFVDDVEQSTGFTNQFLTAPTGSQYAYDFVVFADVANTDRTAKVYERGYDEGPAFAMQIGDMDHGNPSTLGQCRSMHRDARDPSLSHGDDLADHITSQMGLVRIWDDHDYCGQDEDRLCSNRSNAWQAFDEYWPTYDRPNATQGLWHSFEWGAAEFFILDTRSQRDPGTDTDDTSKSMLDGALITNDQLDWLLDGLSNSTKAWKIIVSSVTTNADARPASIDIWHSYSTEADVIADHIADEQIDGVVVISGDLHTGGGLDDGTNGLFGVPEMTVPHTNLINGNTSNLGTWSDGVTAGARGYGHVTVSLNALTLRVVGQNGVVRHTLTL